MNCKPSMLIIQYKFEEKSLKKYAKYVPNAYVMLKPHGEHELERISLFQRVKNIALVKCFNPFQSNKLRKVPT